jgi:MinD superfamily P-loop ATPase
MDARDARGEDATMEMHSPKIAVLSGKGGTGKTLVSVNLAEVCPDSVYVDCDVEEPNGRLFFKPSEVKETPVLVKIPYVDSERCNGSMECVEFCRFNALAHAGGKWMVFEDICHSCGGCMLVCPQKAIAEKDKPIGIIQEGSSQKVQVMTGILNTGQASGTPIIHELLDKLKDTDKTAFIDCPPGSACVVMESIKDADYCVLVAEPSLFGAHNLEMVHELVTLFNKPHGVVLNKCREGENPSEEYCVKNNLKILFQIPYDETLGRMNSEGYIVARENQEYRELFQSLLKILQEEATFHDILGTLLKEVQHEAAVGFKR